VRTSVVIVCLQPGDWLQEAVASVVDQADQVVVVDNGSADGVASVVARRAGAAVVRSERNLGFAAGVNLGVRHTSGDLVALLNDDAVARPGWLARAGEVLERDPGIAAVTPKILYRTPFRAVGIDAEAWQADGDARELGRRIARVTVAGRDVLGQLCGPGIHRLEIDEGGDRWRWSRPGHPVYVPVPPDAPDAEVRIDGEPAAGPLLRLINKAGSWLALDGILGDAGDREPDDGRFDQPFEHFAASGTALVVRAETWARVGELAEPFFAYFEDSDWSWRARLAGLRIVYDPAEVVEHRQSATSGGWATAWVRRWAPANHAACLLRNAPLRQAWPPVRRHLEDINDDRSRLAVASRIPWALSTRWELSRGWALRPDEVWRRWAGVGAPPLLDRPEPTVGPVAAALEQAWTRVSVTAGRAGIGGRRRLR